jgi:hypothetical protein
MIVRSLVSFLLFAVTWNWGAIDQQVEPGAKVMFYNPGGTDTQTSPVLFPDPVRRIRQVNYRTPLRHCGIHYWFEDGKNVLLSEQAASRLLGPVELFVRANCDGFLTVFEMDGDGKELTQRTDSNWSGYHLGDLIYRVGPFAFAAQGPGKRLIIVWARSQTEVARSTADAARRLIDMPRIWKIVSQSEDATVGEIGTYVVNRVDAGVAAEILFLRR